MISKLVPLLHRALPLSPFPSVPLPFSLPPPKSPPGLTRHPSVGACDVCFMLVAAGREVGQLPRASQCARARMVL